MRMQHVQRRWSGGGGWLPARCALPAVILVFGMSLARDARSSDALPAATQGGGFTLTITLSRDPAVTAPDYDFCGTSSSVVAYSGEVVRWCYTIRNNLPQALTRHDLTSSGFGNILSAFPLVLAPGATAFVTRTEVASVTRTDAATWVSYNPGPIHINADSATARLTVQEDVDGVFRDGFE
jgi:hypothetical protein